MARIFVSHPFAADPDRNGALVRRIARRLALDGHLPLAPQIYLPQFLDEARERDLALGLCLKIVAVADEVQFYGDETEGVRLELAEARRLGIPVARGSYRAD